MVDRIRTLLQVRQLSTTQFADAIGVARPVISHILSGRNKPSLEVVQRILAAFPDLSMAWLLNGTEPMLTSTAVAAEVPPAPRPATTLAPAVTAPLPRPAAFPRRSAPAASSAAQVVMPTEPLKPSLTGPLPPIVTSAAPVAPITPPQPPIEPLPINPEAASSGLEPTQTPSAAQQGATLAAPPVIAPPVAVGAVAPLPPAGAETAALLGQSDKAIRRIVIFYRDGSFADYQPE